MRKAVVYLLSLFIFSQVNLFAYSTNPKDFVNELVNEAINKLADKNFTKEEKAIHVEKIAIENVDIKALGLYTLGELRKSASENDISDYQKSFEK